MKLKSSLALLVFMASLATYSSWAIAQSQEEEVLSQNQDMTDDQYRPPRPRPGPHPGPRPGPRPGPHPGPRPGPHPGPHHPHPRPTHPNPGHDRYHRGHYPWPHHRHEFRRPYYPWDWQYVREVTCVSEDSLGRRYYVTDDGYSPWGYQTGIEQIEDGAIDRCLHESGGDPSCHLLICEPTY